ncbi:hemagglutinin protein [uncultured Kordia sp.]|uniref:hemagglutinin protein n=1 Tax=uncultured Kordia sp. TaxID=507699 RepID=UPI00260D0622|nr:hemagglutinin protein [uncultured Kordia sp.]
MRTKYIVLIVLLVSHIGFTQTIEKYSIDSGGASATAEGIEILYTIGETNIQEYSTTTLSVSEGFITTNFKININPKIFLQGPLLNPATAGLMNDDLRSNDHLPITSPYADTATVVATVFNLGGTSGTGMTQNDIVDWVWIEIRQANDDTKIVRAQSALVQRDGDIVDLDGVSTLELNAAPTNYYVVIKHRNHLGIMSANVITLNSSVTSVDFTNPTTQTFGSNAQTVFGIPTGTVAMWAGDANGDAIVQYSGTTPDSPSILSLVLNDAGNFLSFPTFVVSGYNMHDVNMDGNTQYTGTSPDTPIILQNVLAHPGNFLNFSTYQILEQLPTN